MLDTTSRSAPRRAAATSAWARTSRETSDPSTPTTTVGRCPPTAPAPVVGPGHRCSSIQGPAVCRARRPPTAAARKLAGQQAEGPTRRDQGPDGPRPETLGRSVRPDLASSSRRHRGVAVQARDVMTREVVTVGPDTSAKYAAVMTAERGFAAMPVVDDDDELV